MTEESLLKISHFAAASDLEEQRLQALLIHELEDTEDEKKIHNLVALAADVCKTPVSLLNITTHDRLWLEAGTGLTTPETSCMADFCQHVLMQGEVMEIADTLCDIRFYQNCNVVAEPHIRFFAAAPLVNATGVRMGTLCVVDVETRGLTESQKYSLAELADKLVAHLEYRLEKRIEQQQRAS